MQIETILAIAAIVAVCLIALKLYTYKKARHLRELGYSFVYYYMKNCGNLQYYKDKDKHIEEAYHRSYEELETKKEKWYLSVSSKWIVQELVNFYKAANLLTVGIEPYFYITHYFAYSECERFKKQASGLEDSMSKIVNIEFRKYIIKETGEKEIYDYPKDKKYEHNLESLRQIHNKEFVDKELRDNYHYFDHLLKYPLDEQQRKSIVELEDNCLVISSAGSGKTSTSIAKVKYLLDKQNLSKDEILVLSYNHKTAEEFQERLDIPGLTCKTFHALALSIIGDVEGKRPDICDETFLITCYYNLIKRIPEYKTAVNKFVSEVSSLTKSQHEYKTAEEYFKDRETYGIMSPYGDMNGGPIFTKSEEERKICIWLSSHDISFLYEQPYPIDTGDKEHRNYKPDFTIYFTKDGKDYYLFLEHFGIDKNGNVPQWFGDGSGGFVAANRKYNSDILWKRQLHAQNNTRLLETTSAMFHDGTIYQKLEKQLREAGVPMRLLSEDEKYERLIERNKAAEDSIMDLFKSFINLMKSNGKSFDTIMEDIKKENLGEDFNERSGYLMYEVIKPLYDEYETNLKERKLMDFTDLVLYAADLCNSWRYKSPYSYIIVDEFQDISVDRYKFILSLRKSDPLTKTYCVGDDWQSIYRFSGSDMNLFNHFEDYFGYTKRCKIETTYRFGNPLVEKSSKFILKNPNQVEKTVRPLSDNVTTKLSFVPFTRENGNYLNEIWRIIGSIPKDESIMLIARYNYEVYVFPKDVIKQRPNSKRAKVYFAGREMDFMSVHAAKGLEADNVLILNCSQDQGGFPSRMTDDPILGFVLSKIDTFEYSEERRLFYVAITRAKKHTFVLYNDNMPSVFVTEILDGEDNNQMLCPLCKKGRLKKIKDGVSINGNKYRSHLCTNSVAGCHFHWLAFYDDESDILRKYHREMDRYFIDIKSDKDGWPIIGGQTTNTRRRPGIPPSPSFPTYIPPPFPPPPPSGGSYSPPLPPIEGSPDDLPF